jgi:hypothetical protein
MFYLLLGINTVLIAVLFLMAKSRQYGKFASSALNPLNVFAVLSIFYNLDFVFVSGRPELTFLEHQLVFSPSELDYAYLSYTFLFSMVVFGLVVAHVSALRLPRAPVPMPPPETMVDMRQSSAAVMFGAFVCCVPAVMIAARYMDDILTGAITFQIFSRENLFFIVTMFLVQPSLAIFLSLRPPWHPQCILVLIAAMAVLFISGTRSHVIFALVIFVIALITHGLRVPVFRFYVVAIPAIATFLAFSRYLRESFMYTSFTDFVEQGGGFLDLFFGSTEVGIAKIFSAALLYGDALDRSPFTSLFAMIMFPFPRDIFTFKPLGASAYFTEQLAPLRWIYTRSEITVTGYGDLVLSFGVLGAAAVLPMLSFLWLRACISAIHAQVPWNITVLSFLIWWMFVFLRTDLYNLSSLIWPFVVVVGGYYTLVTARGSMRRSKRRRMVRGA